MTESSRFRETIHQSRDGVEFTTELSSLDLVVVAVSDVEDVVAGVVADTQGMLELGTHPLTISVSI